MKIAATGHRPNKLNNEYDGIGPISKALREKFYKIIEEKNPSKMISGMALGVDMLWAECAIEKNIPLVAAIPCKGQEDIWPKESQERYHNILLDASEVVMVSDMRYTFRCMQDRNVWMVDNCDILVAVWNGSKGGTYNCVKHAEGLQKEIIRIIPPDQF